MIRLEPCPFCGNIPLMELVQIDEPVTNFDKYYRLGCKPCHFFVNYTIRSLIDKEEHEKAKIHLAEEWNKRAMVKQPKVVRCKDCIHKGNPYECHLDRDLEEHGGHRSEAYDDWFCADGERKDD